MIFLDADPNKLPYFVMMKTISSTDSLLITVTVGKVMAGNNITSVYCLHSESIQDHRGNVSIPGCILRRMRLKTC